MDRAGHPRSAIAWSSRAGRRVPSARHRCRVGDRIRRLDPTERPCVDLVPGVANARTGGHIPELDDSGPPVPCSALPAPLPLAHGTARRPLAGHPRAVPRGRQRRQRRATHFIGSVVAVEREPDPLHDFRDFRIVDGQQRLTTLRSRSPRSGTSLRGRSGQFDRLNAKYLVNTTEPKASERGRGWCQVRGRAGLLDGADRPR